MFDVWIADGAKGKIELVAPFDLLRSLSQEIDDVSAKCELDMRRVVTRTLGANYYPLPEFTYTEWLGQVAAHLRQHAAAIDGGATPPTA